jgi:hypothetical protein
MLTARSTSPLAVSRSTRALTSDKPHMAMTVATSLLRRSCAARTTMPPDDVRGTVCGACDPLTCAAGLSAASHISHRASGVSFKNVHVGHSDMMTAV